MITARDIPIDSAEIRRLTVADLRRMTDALAATASRLEAEFAESRRRLDLIALRFADLVAAMARKEALSRSLRGVADGRRRA